MVNHMVNDRDNALALDATFTALADPTRRAILRRLHRGPATVGELAGPFAMSAPAVSKHLRMLERAGLVARTREGRVHRIELATATLAEALRWIESCREFWEPRLDSLGRHLASRQAEKESR